MKIWYARERWELVGKIFKKIGENLRIWKSSTTNIRKISEENITKNLREIEGKLERNLKDIYENFEGNLREIWSYN